MDILIVEDDELQRKVLYDLLKKEGHQVRACDCLAEARARLASESMHLLFLDRRLPDGDGLEFVSACAQKNPEMHVVVMTAFADVPSVVQAIRNGAYDYLPKPIQPEEFSKIVRNVEKSVSMQERVAGLARLSSTAGGGCLAAGRDDRQCGPAGDFRESAADSAVSRHDGAAAGGERNRQGDDGQCDPPVEQPGGQAVCGHQLLRDTGHADGKRDFRL